MMRLCPRVLLTTSSSSYAQLLFFLSVSWPVFLTFLPEATAQSPVYILNRHQQLITSSTLQWVTAHDGDRPVDSVPGGGHSGAQYSTFVCRAAQRGGGHFHAGQLYREACHVTIGDQVLSFRKYQVLVNVDGAARLEWHHWQQFSEVPEGAVSTDINIYPARVDFEDLDSHQTSVGGLYSKEKFGIIIVPASKNMMKHLKGEVLVEIEPEWFELTDFFHGRQVSEKFEFVQVSDQDIVLSEVSSPFGRVFNVTTDRLLYFGRGHSVPSGKRVIVRFRNNTSVDLIWGVVKEQPVMRQIRINYPVPKDTNVRVSLSAKEIRRKFEYTATLIAHYADGKRISRDIKARFTTTDLDHFAPVFSDPMPSISRDYRSKIRVLTENDPEPDSASTTTEANPSHDDSVASTSRRFPSMIKSYRYPIKNSSDDSGANLSGHFNVAPSQKATSGVKHRSSNFTMIQSIIILCLFPFL